MKLLRLIGLLLATLVVATVALSSCATREIPFATLQERYALPNSGYVSLSGGERVHYVLEGPSDAPAIVMVHGFAASVHAWTPWREKLRGQYLTLSLDLPGHGLTETPSAYRGSLDRQIEIVGETATALGLDHFVLAGNSMGGAVAWGFALAHPQRLDGLVLVNPAGWPGERAADADGPPLVFRMLNNAAGRAVLKWFDPATFARGGLKSAYLDPELVTEDLIRRYADLALAPGHRDVLLTMRRGRSYNREDFGRISVPTLVMVGDQDKIIPAEQTRAMAASIPGAKLIAYPDGGHVPMEQLPEATSRDLTTFLQDIFAR